MTNNQAVNWLINVRADIGKAEYRELWHYEQALAEIIELLEETERKHGRWEFIGDQIFRCPECGQTFSKMLLEGWGTYLDRLYLPLCPDCGARMVGEQE